MVICKTETYLVFLIWYTKNWTLDGTVHVHCFIHQYRHQHVNISSFLRETAETIHSILNTDYFIILFSQVCQGRSTKLKVAPYTKLKVAPYTKLKVAPYTKGFTFLQPTSQYGDLNIFKL